MNATMVWVTCGFGSAARARRVRGGAWRVLVEPVVQFGTADDIDFSSTVINHRGAYEPVFWLPGSRDTHEELTLPQPCINAHTVDRLGERRASCGVYRPPLARSRVQLCGSLARTRPPQPGTSSIR